MDVPSFVYVWVVWEKNFIELRKMIAVYQFNEYGPCVGQGNKGGPTLHRGGGYLWHFGHVP